MKHPLCFLILLTQLCLISSTSVYRWRLNSTSYGVPCSRDEDCTGNENLFCSDGWCNCVVSPSIFYNGTTGKCVEFGKNWCYIKSVDIDVLRYTVYYCSHNSDCKDDICACDVYHYRDSHNTCSEKHSHGEDCVTDNMCREKRHLVCGENQKCKCHEGRIFDDLFNECVLQVGQPCSADDKCALHASCNDSICTCTSDYFPLPSGTCELKHSIGKTCQNSDTCIDHVIRNSTKYPSLLVCLNGTCRCDAEQSRESQVEKGQTFCEKLVGAYCNHTRPRECTTGATCSKSLKTCQCDHKYYYASPQRTCESKTLMKYGQPCSADDHCDYARKLICNGTSRICQCEGERVLDANTTSCKLVPGSKCLNNDHSSCVPNAACQGTEAESLKCMCKDHAKSSLKLKDYCYIKEGEQCTGDLSSPVTTKTCLPGLLCRNQTCTCRFKGQQEYNETLEKCVSYLGGPCRQPADCHNPRTECKPVGERGAPWQCRCKAGYAAVGNRCELALGEACVVKSSEICHSMAYLECSSRGKCECPSRYNYKEKKRCKGTLGAGCNPLDSRDPGPCAEGLICRHLSVFDTSEGVCYYKRIKMPRV